MPVVKLEGFSGISPRTGPTELAPTQAQVARNLKLQSGELRPWRKPVTEYTPSSVNTQTVFLLENTSSGLSRWLEWDTDVDVVYGPIADSTDYRIYYTGDGVPKKTNWAMASTLGAGVKPFPNAWLHMGVPAPTVAPTLVKTGGSGTVYEDRAYVYTYVSTFGSITEESAPSPAQTTLAVEPDATITVSAFGTAPFGAGYNITAIRIYRSVSSSTTANYLYVGQVSVNPTTGVASGSFADNVAAANLGVALPSMYYTPPPSGLKGLVAMPNGILAGFTGNQVWFCEPYLPHAWPTAYMMTVGAPIVGLGVFGQTLVVCTTEQPYLISGSLPGAMTQEKLPLPEPCASKRSIASDQFGVLYASPNGIVSVAPGTADVISRPLFTRDEWQTYFPQTMVGAIYQNMYMLFYEGSTSQGALVLMRGDVPPLVSLDTRARCVFVRRSTAAVYVVDPVTSEILQLDADPVNNLFYEWKSKLFMQPEPTNYAAMKMQANWSYIDDVSEYNAYVASINAQNAAIWAAGSIQDPLNDWELNTLDVNGSLLITVPPLAQTRTVQAILRYDGAVEYSWGFTSSEPVRLPADKKTYLCEITLSGNAPVRKFAMATSIAELRQV